MRVVLVKQAYVAEAGGFLVKQKARAGGGRRKKPPPSREGTPEQGQGSPAEAAPEGTQASPSLEASPAVEGGRTGDPFEEAEREEVLFTWQFTYQSTAIGAHLCRRNINLFCPAFSFTMQSVCLAVSLSCNQLFLQS